MSDAAQQSLNKTPKLTYAIRLFPEITIKSAPVRKRWTTLLSQNIRTLGRRLHEGTSVIQDWDRVEVRVPLYSEHTRAEFTDLLARIPGIANFSEVRAFPLVDLHDIYEQTLPFWADALIGKTFSVRVKRNGNHSFSSGDVERYVGGGLNQNVATAGVKLKNPDVTVHIEIKDQLFYVLLGKCKGLGGFPLGTQEPVLSLISGGFDSSVASYQMIKRGMRTHYCFFSIGGRAHELGVKEVAFYLWRKYGASHRVRFITVPFEAVVSEILENISPANMGVVLKRMMIRAAERVAERGGIQALVTGEAISQVSSQTVHNLSAINEVSKMLVFRPLIATAKLDIIDEAREIGVEDFAANMPEYCGVISVKPSAKVNLKALEEEESQFNFAVLDQAVENCKRQQIDEVMKDCASVAEVDSVTILPDAAKVIDIRHPNEQELRPLALPDNDILDIPFYKLNTEMANLDTASAYFLFCERGVMSELHAVHMKEAGFSKVAVYRPDKHKV